MSTKQPIYEGKAKKLFEGPEPGTLIQHFKDDATAFNNKKKGSISGKGVINNRISEFLMTRLSEVGIPTHLIKSLNMREQLVRAVEIIPLEVIVRNYAAGSFAERFKAVEGEPIGAPLIEYCLKNDKLGDPFISEEHIFLFDVCEEIELAEIRHYALRINDYLSGLFRAVGIRLADMKLEFGRYYEGEYVSVILADEISPDTCRLWDVESGASMDKDRFRKDLGDVGEFYREVARRLGIFTGAELVEAGPSDAVSVSIKKPAAKKAAHKPAAKIASKSAPKSTPKSAPKKPAPKGRGKKK
jgi:phosphoribosylaminoimidazole-succinocarboxamide synthase